MEGSYEFLRLVLDSITEHIAVIDDKGYIQFVNHGWRKFGEDNECSISQDWSTVNYFAVCEEAAKMGDDFGVQAGKGIQTVINRECEHFILEYPCHSVDEKRWFIMRASPFELNGKHFFVISHQDVTERKLAEEAVDKLARMDALTDIYNRRAFDEFLNEQWALCLHLNQPICLLVIDLDHFKLLNDTYGHQTGDECLAAIGTLLKTFVRRSGDLCARYGGEEFSIILGNTTLQDAEVLSNELLEQVRQLKIPNEYSPMVPYVTASIGLVEMTPDVTLKSRDLIAQADNLLYKAKEGGRNKMELQKVSSPVSRK